MDRNALAELLQALESRRDAEERRREERYTALIERKDSPEQELEDDEGWKSFVRSLAAELCPGCGAYGHTLAICPTQYEEEKLAPRRGECERPAPRQGERERPAPRRGERERPAPERLLSPPPWKDMHLPRQTTSLSSEGIIYFLGIWDWLEESERDFEEAFPVVINLLQARDGERWKAWEQQHHPASLPDIAAMVLRYLAEDIKRVPPFPGPQKGEASLQSPVSGWEEPERPMPEWEEHEHPTPEWEEPERPTPEWVEPKHPTPEWEEPERPTPEDQLIFLPGASAHTTAAMLAPGVNHSAASPAHQHDNRVD
ncbi:UNVERIFIED_CONTAM: hypothetical protein FKN15_051890 [Acipenser sinensis]